jgi:aromatic-L-amino-acid/L-tryptophan decarboxylase
MDIGEIERWGAKAAQWGAAYLAGLRERPVRAPVEPGDTAKLLPVAPPANPEAMETIFGDFEKIVMPGMTHWQHPRFFAYFPANSSPPSVIAEYLTATLAAQCMLWQTSPAATELETRMLDWLRQMIGLPDGFSGVIQDSATSATLAAILVAREKALSFTGNQSGLSGLARLRVYCSEQCHSSVDKACRLAGIGQDNLVKLKGQGRLSGLDPAELDAKIHADRDHGLTPAAIIACIGGTSIGACDDVAAICAVADRHDVFVHVDAAWAGSAMICPEFRHLIKGAERADSFVFNPHKWLATNFDCAAHFIRDPEALVRTLGLRPPFLETMGQDEIVNYNEWSIPLGRRFRALKLWFVIRSYGVDGLRAMIRNHVRWGNRFAERIKAEPDFQLTSTPVLSLSTFRYKRQGDHNPSAINRRLFKAINDDGRIYLTQTRIDGRFVIRFQVGQTYTTEDDVDFAFKVITETARSLP